VSARRVWPTLWVELPLEGTGRVWLHADSREDELRLRAWLRRSRELRVLPEALERLLDDLDESEDRAA
jgi:hypothetical protein